MFFIVLDLRLTKVGARRCSFFYVHTLSKLFQFYKIIYECLGQCSIIDSTLESSVTK
ncbi:MULTISPECIES: hypothetical protein [Bacteroides]